MMSALQQTGSAPTASEKDHLYLYIPCICRRSVRHCSGNSGRTNRRLVTFILFSGLASDVVFFFTLLLYGNGLS